MFENWWESASALLSAPFPLFIVIIGASLCTLSFSWTSKDNEDD